MKVEIWSDIMCPFCYIGKRHFEKALQQFEHADNIEVEWKSFQLDPAIENGVSKDIYSYLAEKKGFSYQQSVQMHEHVTQMAREAGLNYQFEKAKVANSFNAHRLIQLAKQYGLGDAAEEVLFKAYFEEGKDLGSVEELKTIGLTIGIPAEKLEGYFSTQDGTAAVNKDIAEAQQIGVRGVPFFVFNRKYAVSGAQPADHFKQALQQSFSEWQTQQPALKIIEADGASCDVETGECN